MKEPFVTQLVLMTGPPAVGKTSVAMALAEQLPGVSARLCGDVYLMSVRPFEATEERRLFLRKNLVSFTRHAADHGYDWVIIEFVILADAFVDTLVEEVREAVDCVTSVSLVADEDVYLARVRSAAEGEHVSQEHISACRQWMSQIRDLQSCRPIDITGMGPMDAARRVRDLIEGVGREAG
jgi:chloramphenicol 3-O-phosphotransferase